MKSIIFTFGRFQPPTKGHQKLIEQVKILSKNSDHLIFISHTHNKITDPLTWDYKLKLLREIFPNTEFCDDENIKTPFQALEYLGLGLGYNNITMVVGNDRLKEFKKGMTPYLKNWNISSFRIISSGTRESKSRKISGLSGTKLRNYVLKNCKISFCKAMPNTINNDTKLQVFDEIRKILISI